MNTQLQSVALSAATFTMIIIALSVVMFVMFCPLIGFFLLLDMKNPAWWIWTTASFLQGLHLKLLWTSMLYLSIYRKLLFPLRQPIMALLPIITRIECIREQSQPTYVDVTKIPRVNGQSEVDALLSSFRRGVRKTYKQREAMYRQDRISCESLATDDSMRLCDIAPVMWEHERETCKVEGGIVAVEFLKRFLVVVMATNANLDLYRDKDNTLCCIQLSFVQGDVLVYSLYFSTKHRSGIWYHGLLNAMVRAMRMDSVRYVNTGNHFLEAKRRAGCTIVELDDPLLSNLYPVTLTRDTPKSIRCAGVWEETTKKGSTSK